MCFATPPSFLLRGRPCVVVASSASFLFQARLTERHLWSCHIVPCLMMLSQQPPYASSSSFFFSALPPSFALSPTGVPAGFPDMVDGVRVVQPSVRASPGTPSAVAAVFDAAAKAGRGAGGGRVLHGDDDGGPHQPLGRAADEASGGRAPGR